MATEQRRTGRLDQLEAGSVISAHERPESDGRTCIEDEDSVKSFSGNQAAVFTGTPLTPIRGCPSKMWGKKARPYLFWLASHGQWDSISFWRNQPTNKNTETMLALGSWNVGTLLDTLNNNARRRTALLANELLRYNIDIAALSETRFPDAGELQERNYTFYWSSCSDTWKGTSGVAVFNHVARQLTKYPKAIYA